MGQNINSNYIAPNPIINNQRAMDMLTNSVKEIAKNLFVSMGFGFIEENQPVFNGNVADEITKIQSQMHSLGVVMREGQVKHSFNRNM